MIGGAWRWRWRERSNQHFPESQVPWVRALFSKRTKKIFLLPLCSASSSFSTSSTLLSTALLSVLFVVFHSLICSVITAKNDREQFLSISTRENSLPALSSSGPPSSRGTVLPLQQCTISIFRFQSSRNRGVGR